MQPIVVASLTVVSASNFVNKGRISTHNRNSLRYFRLYKDTTLQQIVIVSDEFIEDSKGGAELTTAALLNVAPHQKLKIRTHQLTPEIIRQHSKCLWIFANYFHLDFRLVPQITETLTYVVIEYDLKFCKYRSPATHAAASGEPCDCGITPRGLLVSSFLCYAAAIFWMSRKQMEKFYSMCPPLKETSNVILSSAFSLETLDALRNLRAEFAQRRSDRWIVIGSPVWMKGKEEGERYCLERGLPYDVIWDKPYDELLRILAQSKGLVFLPRDGDTCPRLVIEAKLLGCELTLNDNVMHRYEPWFATDDLGSIEDYLLRVPYRFWNQIYKISEQHRATL
jgi:hypothetical protein